MDVHPPKYGTIGFDSWPNKYRLPLETNLAIVNTTGPHVLQSGSDFHVLKSPWHRTAPGCLGCSRPCHVDGFWFIQGWSSLTWSEWRRSGHCKKGAEMGLKRTAKFDGFSRLIVIFRHFPCTGHYLRGLHLSHFQAWWCESRCHLERLHWKSERKAMGKWRFKDQTFVFDWMRFIQFIADADIIWESVG